MVNTFSNKVFSEVPNTQTLPLYSLMENLDTLWRRSCQSSYHTGRGLDSNAKAHLASKLTSKLMTMSA